RVQRKLNPFFVPTIQPTAPGARHERRRLLQYSRRTGNALPPCSQLSQQVRRSLETDRAGDCGWASVAGADWLCALVDRDPLLHGQSAAKRALIDKPASAQQGNVCYLFKSLAAVRGTAGALAAYRPSRSNRIRRPGRTDPDRGHRTDKSLQDENQPCILDWNIAGMSPRSVPT